MFADAHKEPSRRGARCKGLDYCKLPTPSLALMYAAVLQAIAADGLAIRNGEQPPHQIHDTPEWQDHAKALEEELFAKADFGRGN